jgi:diadenosine tetraphosphate (Ap4A) HIT family hydrolase
VLRGIKMNNNSQNNRILFKGDRDAWQDFMYKVKKNKKQVWEDFEPMLNKYTNNNSKNKVSK